MALQIGQPTLPLTHNLFNFGSWMGGDRDGNPYVKADTTRDVVINARLAAVNAFFNAIEELMFELSIWRCNTEMQVGMSTTIDLTFLPCYESITCLSADELQDGCTM